MSHPRRFALLRRLVPAEPHELPAALLGFGCFFCVLASYYVVRPLRDSLGSGERTRGLAELFSATFLAVLAAQPAYAALAARVRRATLVKILWHFFALDLVLFWIGFGALQGDARKHAAEVFFVWVTVFNIFIVAVFWTLLADAFSHAQSKRLFAFIGAGGQAGAIAGSLATAVLPGMIRADHMLLVSAAALEVALVFALKLSRAAARARSADPAGSSAGDERAPPGGGLVAGLRLLVTTPVLRGVAVYLFLSTFAGTVTYLMQQGLAEAALPDRAARARFFSSQNLAYLSAAALIEALLTERVIRRFGVGITLAVLPTFSAAALLVVGVSPVFAVVACAEGARRAIGFAVAQPSRETLFTTVPRPARFGSKAFIDTVVFRGGDAVSAWLYQVLHGIGVVAPALAAVPVCVLWAVLGRRLGREKPRAAA